MNLPLFIAKRIAIASSKSFSLFITKIAILAISLSIAVMIIGTAITQGYQHTIQQKFYNCWGHIHITTFLPEPNSLLNDEKIIRDTVLEKKILSHPNVSDVFPYAMQSCILKTDYGMEGIILKGITETRHLQRFNDYLVQGSLIQFTDSLAQEQILISKFLADKLNVATGQKILLYFINKEDFQPRIRKVKISGVYSTGIEDYDKLMVICSRSLILSINKEEPNTIQGYEVYLKDKDLQINTANELFSQFIQPPLEVYPIQTRFSNIFSWLGMMKMNERIIIGIMMLIAFVNMITALLILILERTRMVGVLKSLGMPNSEIRKIFLYSGFYIVLLGVALGLVMGLGLCWVQQKYGFIALNESAYYVKTIPIYLNFNSIVMIVAMSILFCTLILQIPSLIINKISPTKALQFR